MIISKPTNKNYRKNWDVVFVKKTTVSVGDRVRDEIVMVNQEDINFLSNGMVSFKADKK